MDFKNVAQAGPSLELPCFWLMGEDFHIQSVVLDNAKVQ